jgi:tetratricopeptide (TPR) repeat protein
MKLGELYFRKGDFAGARIQLESLAGKFPGSAQEMPALFLAAQSASRLQTPASANEAMMLYEQVAAANGALSLRARLEQAILQAALGRRSEAIVIFDSILAANPDPETRAAALMEKAKALLANADGASTASALKVLEGLARDTTLSPSWKNQALVRIGAAHETLGDTDAAVSSYYDVLKESGSAEFFWFYKAGFAAARLLESAKRWDQAIRVYEMISAANGPRSKEAASRINKIRLENFLWESKPEN